MNGSEKKYKILIVNGQSIHGNNATALTMRNIFSKFDPSDILEFCFAKTGNESEGIKSISFDKNTNRMMNFVINYLDKKNLRNRFNKTIEHDHLSSNLKAVSIKNGFKKIVLSHLDACPIKLNNDMIQTAQEFQPDVIYTLGASISVMKICLKLSDELSCPILLHFMDNWRESIYKSLLLTYPRSIIQGLIKRIEKRSKAGLTISEKMSNDYSTVSGVKYYALMNPVEVNKIKFSAKENNGNFKIIYTGGLHLNRHISLLDIEHSIVNSNKLSHRCSLHIYTSEKDQYFANMFDSSVTTFHKFVDHDKIFDIYNSADILLHIESFDPELFSFIKYSLSTKISEYLSASKPIICYAPENTAVFEYINNNHAGYSISDKKDIADIINAIISNPVLSAEMGNNGYETANTRHSVESSFNTILKAIEENIYAK